ncbi:Enoyl-(Acyl carrier protein) reductase [Peribacillus simplex]|uniref:Enoyl-(Acyl carrier protein) reductase n=1 Tax=Peribacillus simplex TaxID=1478 RepID=A0A9X8RE10_9BACI|nr:Enoyl-(Acyl carrier protein) reductase [Peribacillus simplex]
MVNNAGGPPGGNFEQISDEDWQKSFELNLLSYIRIIREVLPDMKKGGGRIINIASTSIKQPIPELILSNTIRLGIVGLTKTLSVELAPYNILFNTVAPGRIATERTDHLDQINADRQGISREAAAEQSKKTIPLERYGTPEEFAKVVTFLVSEASTYITGSSVLVDGEMVTSIWLSVQWQLLSRGKGQNLFKHLINTLSKINQVRGLPIHRIRFWCKKLKLMVSNLAI